MFVGNYSAGAIFDGSGKYRYALWRIWNVSRLNIGWILLNPLNADESKLNTVLKRCKRYTSLWGYGGFYVFNLFGLRSTNIRELLQAKDPVGGANDSIILLKSINLDKIILAWGNAALRFKDRLREFDDLMKYEELYALKRTERGQPSYPSNIKRDKRPFIYKRKNESLLEACGING